MIRKNYLVTLMVLTILFLLPTPKVNAWDFEITRRSLKGIGGVFVLIETIDSSLQEVGITEDIIRTDVELKLRLAGIKVLSQEEIAKTSGSPYLYILIRSFREDTQRIYPFYISVSVHQSVNLVRKSDFLGGAETWSTDYMGVVGSAKTSFIRDSVKDLTDKFINTYLSVNPKK